MRLLLRVNDKGVCRIPFSAFHKVIYFFCWASPWWWSQALYHRFFYSKNLKLDYTYFK